MSDEPRDPPLEAVLMSLMDATRESMMGAMPGVVVSYDPATRKAQIQPALQRAHFDESGNRAQEMLPVLNDVPVIMPGTSSIRVKFPINPGDHVLLVFCGQSLDVWKQRGGVVDDSDDRRHDLTDAIAIPGVVNFGAASEADPLIEFTGAEIHVGGSGALVTQAQFMNHTHLTAGTGSPVPPTSISPTPTLTGTTVIKGA